MRSRPDVDGASIDLPPIPTTTLFLHVSARVCGIVEFREAHGAHVLDALLPLPTPKVQVTAAARSLLSGRAPSARGDEAVLSDVMASLMADLLRDGAVSDTFDMLNAPSVPYFAALRGGDGDSALAIGLHKAPVPADATSRIAALADPDVQELASKLLENTLLNLIREAAHDEFDPTVPPVTVLRKK
jgi:hypothetical protein